MQVPLVQYDGQIPTNTFGFHLTQIRTSFLKLSAKVKVDSSVDQKSKPRFTQESSAAIVLF